eukprot:15464852-Alexandrium_andersonii.AAC.1
MDDEAIFDVDLGDRHVFTQQVIDWAAYWRPDPQAVEAMRCAPPKVLCVVLSRSPGWSEVTSISKA